MQAVFARFSLVGDDVSFQLYDLKQQGFIGRQELMNKRRPPLSEATLIYSGLDVAISQTQFTKPNSESGLALLTKGAKYIVVQGLPTTGCLPLALALAPENDRDDMGCVASVNKQSYSHNAVLQSKLQDLRAQFPQAVIVYADYWNAYCNVMKNSAKYGFKEPFKACCGAGGGPYNFQLSNPYNWYWDKAFLYWPS